ncbi:MAG: hypothetical protein AB8B93_19045 [Pseudomonadales bacterium]
MNITGGLLMTILLLASGCSVLGPRTEPSLDPDSGEMVVALREAMVYSKSEPGLSQSAQDFLYLGPVEGNASGTQTLYLWVGFASTIDRGRAGIHEGEFSKLTLTSAQGSLSLPLEDWHADTQDSPFAIKIPLLQSMRARIAAADFEQLAQADQVQLALTGTDGSSYPFTHWDGNWADWRDASSEAEIGFDVRVHTPRRP